MTAGTLDGKVALVTGGEAGIGFGSAQRLIEEGAFVFITGRDPDELDRATRALGPKCRAIQADVARRQDMLRVAEVIRTEKGSLQIVFCNVGGAGGMPLGATTEEFVDSVFNANVKGALFTVQAMLPLLEDGGSIILYASIAIRMGAPDRAVSAACEAAVRSFARSWTTDLRHRGIRVNAISSGTIPTQGYAKLGHSDEEIASVDRQVAAGIPAGRVGAPGDIGHAVAFLASDAASFITGAEVIVDGGMTQVRAPGFQRRLLD